MSRSTKPGNFNWSIHIPTVVLQEQGGHGIILGSRRVPVLSAVVTGGKVAKDTTLSFHFEDTPEKRALHVSGAYGGPVPDGSVVIAHVYVEMPMIPSLQQYPVAETGGHLTQSGPPQVIKRGDFTREVQATLILTPEVAISVGDWLREKGVRGLEARTGRTEDPAGR